jgi:hypothetical protein
MWEMAIWKDKGCPQCNADLLIQLEADGWYEECLWCGYERNVNHLIVIDTSGRQKTNDRITTNQKIYDNVRVTLEN